MMQFSTQDQLRLNVLRVRYLKESFPVLEDVALMFVGGDLPELRIGCEDDEQVGLVLSERMMLMHSLCNLTGILKISLFLQGECVWEGDYPEFLEQAVQSVLFSLVEEEPMPATLERPTETSASTAIARPLPAQALKDIAADLNQPVERIEEYALASGTQPLLWEGNLLIPGNVAADIYQALWSESLDALLVLRGLKPEGGDCGPATIPRAAKPATKVQAKARTRKRTPAKRKPTAKKTEG